ncbi:glucosaminidase domain-containing protein [Enterococcus sp.]|uniref:glucosaminidase domain-containing protein n=1 Tax=Enterococcus sp. TaxID=35783 RepID=UPI00290CACE1|nr:glucosaminidase domain-containing protein [Enterococcus sp.]MDU5336615.1 NlpC/P60 family protein [Enterococcus sp.]
MSNKVLTRRELRQQKRQKTINYRNLKKGSAVVGTALVAVSVAAPLLNTHEVEAVEGKTTATTSNVDKKAFINEISNEIKPLAEKHDLYASIMIAQAIVESDWGQTDYAQAPYYNLFGLEGQYQGKSAMLDRKDPETGTTEKKEMKQYGSYKEAIEDYIEILKTTSRDGNENYFSGTWRSNAKDYQTAAAALEGRFNDDKDYVQKLVSTIQEHDLTSYDATEPVVPPVAQPAVETPAQPVQYTVQSGDTVGSIAAQFGISVEDFLAWNNVSDSNIYAGQTVVVGNGTVTEAAAPVAQTAPVETAAPVVETTPVVENQPVVDNTPIAEVTPAPETPVVTPEVPQAEPDALVQKEQAPAQEEQAPAEVPTVEKQPEVAQPEQTQPEQTQPEQTPAPEQTTPEQTTPEQPAAETPATTPEQTAPEQSTNSQGQQIVNEAEKYIGTPYVWGGKDTSGFDCSGLTQYVYKQVTGKDIGVWTVAQESSGTTIDVSQAQQGDLLFWGDQGSSYHVAISAGGDSYIHAPQPGENVKYGSTQYYAPDFGVRVY